MIKIKDIAKRNCIKKRNVMRICEGLSIPLHYVSFQREIWSDTIKGCESYKEYCVGEWYYEAIKRCINSMKESNSENIEENTKEINKNKKIKASKIVNSYKKTTFFKFASRKLL